MGLRPQLGLLRAIPRRTVAALALPLKTPGSPLPCWRFWPAGPRALGLMCRLQAPLVLITALLLAIRWSAGPLRARRCRHACLKLVPLIFCRPLRLSAGHGPDQRRPGLVRAAASEWEGLLLTVL